MKADCEGLSISNPRGDRAVAYVRQLLSAT
jgi:hypothetical protein